MNFPTYAKRVLALYAYAPSGRSPELAAPATEARLAALEADVGKKLPAAVRAMWRFADGAAGGIPVFARPRFLTGYDFLSVASARRERDAFRRRAPRYEGYDGPKRSPKIQPGWFSEGWVPFAAFGGGSLVLMVDMTPGPKGTKGQVIAFTHDPDEITWVAPSFADYLDASLKAFAKNLDEYLDLI